MRRTDDQLRDYADEHLLYEIVMVAGLTARMARHAELFEAGLSEGDAPLADEVLELAGRNADLEAWVTHVSNIFNFLICNRKHADVVAYEFFEEPHDWTGLLPRRPKSLERLNARVPVEIDHLSFGRTRVKDKTWQYEEVWRDLAGLLRLFIDNIPAGHMSTAFADAVRSGLPAEDASIEDVARLRVGATTADTGYTSTATIYDGGTATLMPRFETPPADEPESTD